MGSKIKVAEDILYKNAFPQHRRIIDGICVTITEAVSRNYMSVTERGTAKINITIKYITL